MKKILKNLNKIIKNINGKQFKNKINKQTLKIHPKNPGDTIVNPPIISTDSELFWSLGTQ